MKRNRHFCYISWRDFFYKKIPNSNFGLGDKVLEKGDEEDKRWNLVSLSHFLSTISTETKFLMTSIQFLSQKFKDDRNPFLNSILTLSAISR